MNIQISKTTPKFISRHVKPHHRELTKDARTNDNTGFLLIQYVNADTIFSR